MTGTVNLKCVLLGSESVGKSSLLERYVYGKFSGTYQNTIGAAFAGKSIQSGKRTFLIGLWDTAGSERYEAISRMYYRDAKAAIVCYDITDTNSWSKAKFWICEVRCKEEKCRIYICGTKKDKFADRQVEINTASRYADSIMASYMETSSKTGENVEELFQLIADDFIANPENVQRVQETITLTARQRRSSTCCS